MTVKDLAKQLDKLAVNPDEGFKMRWKLANLMDQHRKTVQELFPGKQFIGRQDVSQAIERLDPKPKQQPKEKGSWDDVKDFI